MKTEKLIYRVTHIDWDTDGESVDLPSHVDIPISKLLYYGETIRKDADYEELEELEDRIADYLSNEYGWCVNGFKPFLAKESYSDTDKVYLCVYRQDEEMLLKAEVNLNDYDLFWQVVDNLSQLNKVFYDADYSITQKSDRTEVAIHLWEFDKLRFDLPTIWNKIINILPELQSVPQSAIHYNRRYL